MQDSFDFREFFPKEYTVKEISSSPEALTLDLESTSTHAPCPKCGFSSYRIHGKRRRKNIVDLPFLERSVLLNITLNEYICPECMQIFAENPGDFLLERKSVTARCENHISEVKHILRGNNAKTKSIVNSGHIPVQAGVVRYIPVSPVDICDTDRDWIYKIYKICYQDDNPSEHQYSLEELLEKIHANCERELHPSLVDLSLYDLSLLVSSDKRLKERIKK